MSWTDVIELDEWTRIVRGVRVCGWCLHDLRGLTPRQLGDHWADHVHANAQWEALRS